MRLGIGDVTLPLTPAVVAAFQDAVEEMGSDATFHGYGPDLGYDFLREAIAEGDYRARGADISPDEIVISDGSKCDTANIQELFAHDIRIAIPDPVYPVYVDTNVMAGRTGPCRDGRYGGLIYLDCTEDNGFVPDPPRSRVDLVYLCFPNNPTGATITRAQLAAWVELRAQEQGAHPLRCRLRVLHPRRVAAAVDLRDPRRARVRHRVQELLQDRRASPGTRCAFTVIPQDCMAWDAEGGARIPCTSCGAGRMSTKFNGVSYPVQRAAAAVYTPQGRKETRGLSDYYLGNAKIIRERMTGMGFPCIGGAGLPLHLGAGGHGLLEVLRPPAGQGGRRRHPRRRVRHVRRRVRADQRVQLAGKGRAGHAEDGGGGELSCGEGSASRT